MNRSLLLGAGCTAVAALVLGACGSSSSSSTTTSTPAAPVTSAPATTAPPTTAPPTTLAPATTTPSTVAADPPCTAAALQAALPSGTTVVTTDLGFKCEGGYAGAEVNIAPAGAGGPPGGITSDTLFKAQNGAWVEIGRSAANCAAVPASVHVYCTVS